MNTIAKKQYFTLAEANQRLPLVRAIVTDIVELYRDLSERRERLDRIRRLPGSANRDENSVYGEELQQIEDELEKDADRLQVFVDELQSLGADLKDFRVGLVDFLTRVDGEDAYLCWKLGEEEIGYWHEIEAGFQGRRSLLQQAVSEDEAEPSGSEEP